MCIRDSFSSSWLGSAGNFPGYDLVTELTDSTGGGDVTDASLGRGSCIGGEAIMNQYNGDEREVKNWHFMTTPSNTHAPAFYYRRYTGAAYCVDTSNTHAFTKYITIPKGWLADKFTEDAKISTIKVDFRHWVWCGNGPNSALQFNGENYIPKLKVYLDIVNNSTHAYSGGTHSTSYGSAGYHATHNSSRILATIAETTINQGNKNMYIMDDTSTLGYTKNYYSPGSSWYKVDGHGAGNPSRKCMTWYSQSVNHQSPNDAYDLRATFTFAVDDAFTLSDGSSVNLNVNTDSSGVNLQVRCVPIWSGSNDASALGFKSYNSAGIMNESWRVNYIQINTYSTSANTNLGNQFNSMTGNQVALNGTFGTPSQGEADGWDSLWKVYLTVVNKDDIELSLIHISEPTRPY